MSAKKKRFLGYTFATRSEAKKAGLRALSKMKSKEWKIDVWENLGWHFDFHAAGGLITIHCDDDRGLYKLEYSCSIDREYSGADELADERSEEGEYHSDPQKAFEVTVRLIKKHMNSWQKLLDRVEKETKPRREKKRAQHAGRIVDC